LNNILPLPLAGPQVRTGPQQKEEVSAKKVEELLAGTGYTPRL